MTAARPAFAPVPLPEPASAGQPVGTAVLLDASESVVPATRAERVPERSFAPAAPVDDVADVPSEASASPVAGFVVYELAGATYAVPVGEVHEIVRRPRLQPVPGARAAGGRVVLVDVRGRSIPVLDARDDADGGRPAHVLLPVYRHQVGLVVDRVLAVRADLEVEQDDVSPVLPGPALGVLRAPDGGDPVLLASLPSAAGLAAAADRRTP